MKKLFFETEKDGFYGTYYENSKGSDCTVIGLFGDDPNDFMAKCGVKWLHKNGVNALCMSPGKKNYSHVNYPMERIETAIRWLQRMACSGFFHPFLYRKAPSLYALCI